ncbi:MAG: type I pullulanase [Gorillibacterium sp.]|nr:type I pullulanase [Gorillibacterium sp.]
MAVQKELDFNIDYGSPENTSGISVFSRDFDEYYAYDGDDLGVSYTQTESAFRLWAPTATEAKLVLFATSEGEIALELPLEKSEKGTWTLRVSKDLKNWFYTYKVLIGNQWNEAVDPYAKATGINGDRGVIIDFSATNPEGWNASKPEMMDTVDKIIYELHVRDMTSHPESGAFFKGKYLGLAEPGTRGPEGIKTGLDHIVSLGVTDVQLLPIFDFSALSVDERAPEESYNWGYDPQNYNAPEGSYSTNPYNPLSRIRELKQMIQAFHDRGIRVIMDVVYNHVYDGYRINFTKLVPGYYLRYRENGELFDGSFCGNEMASERKMTRKFIMDSIMHWAKEYHIDGFRFDLMGLHDVETMRAIRSNLDRIDPSIFMIGEGWSMECGLPPEDRANQGSAPRLPRIGQFNDHLRNAVKGSTFHGRDSGFVEGAGYLVNEVKKGAAGSIYYNDELYSFASEPEQSVNYVECHDNFTLWDKLKLANHIDDEGIKAMHRLSTAIVMTSQGIPFLHAGQEFMRTKFGVENSYKSPDTVNWMDWQRCADRQDDVNYVRQLIKLRKEHPAFRMKNATDIRSHLYFEEAPDLCVAYTLRDYAGGDHTHHLYVLYHANLWSSELCLPELGQWQIRFGGEHVSSLKEGQLQVHGMGMIVLEVL